MEGGGVKPWKKLPATGQSERRILHSIPPRGSSFLQSSFPIIHLKLAPSKVVHTFPRAANHCLSPGRRGAGGESIHT